VRVLAMISCKVAGASKVVNRKNLKARASLVAPSRLYNGDRGSQAGTQAHWHWQAARAQ